MNELLLALIPYTGVLVTVHSLSGWPAIYVPNYDRKINGLDQQRFEQWVFLIDSTVKRKKTVLAAGRKIESGFIIYLIFGRLEAIFLPFLFDIDGIIFWFYPNNNHSINEQLLFF